MRRTTTIARPAKRQEGYALLLVIFFLALLTVGTMEIGLRVATEGRRQKEEEMIWRGKQYTRGIKLFYRKLGRFPTSVDDLTKPKLGNIRFMRQAYTDPMNKDDGSWRFIYVGPTGQLIGSLKPQNNVLPGATGAQPGATPGSSSGFGFGSPPGSNSATAPPGFGAGTGAQTGSPTGAGTGTGTGGATGTGDQSIPSGDTPTIVGGNIIGVGSKINQPSIIVYEQATNYRLFEFVWNPAKDLGLVGAGGAQPVGAPTGTPGQGSTGAPGGPTPAQPANPNPPPTPNPNPQ